MMKIPRVQNAFQTVSIPSEYNKFPKDTVPKIKPQIGIGNECKKCWIDVFINSSFLNV